MSDVKSSYDCKDGDDFIPPPPGPPPPQVPEGWVARFDDRYQTWYYVNLATKKSQWEKPPGTTDPVAPPVRSPGPPELTPRPPPYTYLQQPASPYNGESSSQPLPQTPGTTQSYHQSPPPPQVSPQPQYPAQYTPQPQAPVSSPPPSTSRGLASRLTSFFKSHSPQPQPRPQYQQYPPQQPQYQPYPPQQSQYQPYPPQQPQYYGAPPPQQGYYQQPQPIYVQGQPARKRGLGAGGAAALGVGGGLLGGMLLADALNDDDAEAYREGFADGADFDGGDFGGGF